MAALSASPTNNLFERHCGRAWATAGDERQSPLSECRVVSSERLGADARRVVEPEFGEAAAPYVEGPERCVKTNTESSSPERRFCVRAH